MTTPTITSVSAVIPYARTTIIGSGFDTTQGSGDVEFRINGVWVDASTVSWSDSTIIALAPAQEGIFDVQVNNDSSGVAYSPSGLYCGIGQATQSPTEYLNPYGQKYNRSFTYIIDEKTGLAVGIRENTY